VRRGRPAVPGEVAVPAGAPPREAHDGEVLAAQAALLESLAEATAEAA
jgi:hypothetical protein